MVVIYLGMGTRSSFGELLHFYVVHLESKGIKKKNITSQYEFVKAIALSWIDLKNYSKINDKKEPIMNQMTIVPLPLDQKDKRRRRPFMHLMIPSDLISTYPT